MEIGVFIESSMHEGGAFRRDAIAKILPELACQSGTDSLTELDWADMLKTSQH